MFIISMAHFILTHVTVGVAIADLITHAAIVVVSAIVVLGGDTEAKQDAHYCPVSTKSSERPKVFEHHRLLELSGGGFGSAPSTFPDMT